MPNISLHAEEICLVDIQRRIQKLLMDGNESNVRNSQFFLQLLDDSYLGAYLNAFHSHLLLLLIKHASLK